MYSKQLTTFLNKYFSNSTKPYDCFLKSNFYDENSLKEFIVNSNGMCFLNGIRLYFAQFLNTQYSNKQLNELLFFYFSKNKIQLLNQRDSNKYYIYSLQEEIDNYFDSKQYNHQIIQNVIQNVSELFYIKIVILHIVNNKIQSITNFLPSIDKYQNDYIVLNNRAFSNSKDECCFHFNLLINQATKITYFIDLLSEINRNTIATVPHKYSNIIQSDTDQSNSDNDSSSDDSDDLCTDICRINIHKQTNKQQNISYNSLKINNNRNVPTHSCGDLNQKCNFCNALFFKHEILTYNNKITGFCCARGKVKLPENESPSPIICALLRGTDPISKDFQYNIRGYNLSLAFTSLG